MGSPTIAFLGLGANLGDRAANLDAALQALTACPGVEVLSRSKLCETDPIGGPPQGRYLNGVAKIATTLPAPALLALCKEIERAAGRDLQAPRNHPRPLDLDLLLFGGDEIDTRDLVVPHPRIWQRAFVREPLAELGAELPPQPELPRVLRSAGEFSARCNQWQRGGCTVALVPTMGALHEGHASLVRLARAECDRVAVTIFVNPLQFGPKEDFQRYPRALEQDLALLARERADAVFVPTAQTMYPQGFATHVAVGDEARDLEGEHRPGHFGGVATVVAKLLAIARPSAAYFGQKDAQQVAVVRRLVFDLELPVRVRVCPTVREADGLALSSRNVYLTPRERAAAPVLYRALCAARDRFAAGERDAQALRRAAAVVLAQEPSVEVEYLEVRREGDLAPVETGPISQARLVVAACLGKTRLIDNLGLGLGEGE